MYCKNDFIPENSFFIILSCWLEMLHFWFAQKEHQFYSLFKLTFKIIITKALRLGCTVAQVKQITISTYMIQHINEVLFKIDGKF